MNLQTQFKRKIFITTILVAIIIIILLCIKIIIINVPYEIFESSFISKEFYSSSLLNSIEPYKITNKDELDNSFDEMFYSVYSTKEIEIAINKAANSPEYKDYIREYGITNFKKYYENYYKEKLYQEAYIPEKEKLIQELNIDHNFFDNYFIICFTDIDLNTAHRFAIGSITYNRISKELHIADKYRDRGDVGGSLIGGSEAYFIKVEKKYEEFSNIKKIDK